MRVRELIDRRQRLMTAEPRPSEPERTSSEEQAAWLSHAVERERRIHDLFERYRDVVAQSLRTFQSGSRTRETYQSTLDVTPGRNLNRTT